LFVKGPPEDLKGTDQHGEPLPREPNGVGNRTILDMIIYGRTDQADAARRLS
jgi:hypothetical protein